MWTSAKWLAKLSQKERKFLNKAGRGATSKALQWSEDDTKPWYNKWNNEGGTVGRLAGAERKAALNKLRPKGDQIFMQDPKNAPMYKLIKASPAITR